MAKKKMFKGAGTKTSGPMTPVTKIPRSGAEAKANARRNKSFEVRNKASVIAPRASDTRAGGKAGGSALNRATEKRLQRETRSVTKTSKLPTKHANVKRSGGGMGGPIDTKIGRDLFGALKKRLR